MKIKLQDGTMKFITDGIREVCEKYKRRAPGSQSERDAQVFFKKLLAKFSDEVISEDFTLHPHAFMGFIPIAATLLLIAMVLLRFGTSVVTSVFAAVLPVLCLLMFLFEFMMYKSFVDFLFPKRVSTNVYAVRKASGETKRRIIFGGHTDASPEWTYSLHGQIKTIAPVMAGAIISMFVNLGINIYFLINVLKTGAPIEFEGVFKVLWIIELCFVPFIIAIYFFINWRVIVDGANDNLSANYIALSVIKEMAEQDLRFENTDVCCLISGSEEAGLRGARAFARKHRKELLDTETVFIAMDTMREVEQLMVYTRGCTGTVKDSKAVGELIREAGRNVGIEMPTAGLYPGAIDAEAFSREGIKAAGFCGVNHDPKTYYHTRKDSWDNISPECIELSLKICLEAASLYDEKGGIASYEKK
ncbi:MAG: M28 family peptidase [Clostridia bacterium]|nr:M28 family peptidase [Clostridia bacterium]